MKIKNYYIIDDIYNKYNTYTFINEFINEIIKNNISYVLLKGENYLELHFLDNIYRFYFVDKIQKTFYDINGDLFNDLFESITANNVDKIFTDDKKINISYNRKERPGFKKYTKKDIRRDSKGNKTNSKVKKKLSMYY